MCLLLDTCVLTQEEYSLEFNANIDPSSLCIQPAKNKLNKYCEFKYIYINV